MTERNIQIVDLPELDAIERERINNAILSHYDKLQSIINNRIRLIVHFKQHNVTGKRRKYGIHSRLSFSGSIVVSNQSGWILVSTLQRALIELERAALKEIGKN